MPMGFLSSLFGRLFGPPGPDQFAKIIDAELRQRGESAESTYDREGFRLIYLENGKEKRVVNLANLHVEFCQAPRKERKAWLARTCAAMANPMEIPDEFEDVKPDLMPSVRPRSMVEYMRLKSQLDGNEPAEMACLPLSDHLVVCLVYDLPSSMQFVMADQVEKWGVTLYEAMEVALQNLDEREFTMMGLGKEGGRGQIYIIETGDSYDATRLLLKEKIRSLPILGKPVAMPVTRNTLLIAGSDDSEGMVAMVHLTEQKAGDARPLCPIPIILEGDDWETWTSPATHPAAEKLRVMKLQYLGEEYADQKELLERFHEEEEVDVFVASYSAVERDGQTRTWAIWSKGVVTWLPRTEYVALFDPETEVSRFVPWDNLQAVAGELMSPQDCYPPRWEVTDFPRPDQMARMKLEDWKGN
jgi:hypothetical protein